MSRLLGIDYGTRRIGVAVSDPDRMFASALCTVDARDPGKALRDLAALCREYEVAAIVVGMPVNMDGTSGPAAKAVTEFISKLAAKTAIPVESWDERLSTAMVERMLIDADVRREKRKEVRDKLAAQAILQGYMEARSSGTANGAQ